MKIDLHYLSTPFGQLTVVALLAAITIAIVAWQDPQEPTVVSPTATKETRPSLPRIFQRPVARFEPVTTSPLQIADALDPVTPATVATVEPPVVAELPLTVFAATETEPGHATPVPLGRLIPCETVFTLESNRLATPVVGLVTAEVWHAGQLVIPLGAEVHGRASLDPTRGRLAASGPWTLVWSDFRADIHQTVQVEGMALSRDPNGLEPTADGTAGLPGVILRTDDWREAKLFAATFLATATAALQDTRSSFSGLGESLVPAATARNATLAGTGAVLREYARQIQEAIKDDGVYVRVPAGTPFYLYVTEPIDGEKFGGSMRSKL